MFITILEQTDKTVDEATVSVYADSMPEATSRATQKLNLEAEKLGKVSTASRVESIGAANDFYTFHFHSNEEEV